MRRRVFKPIIVKTNVSYKSNYNQVNTSNDRVDIPKPNPKKYKDLKVDQIDLNPIESDTIFIIGGGPSLKNFDFTLLDNVDTMCVNAAIKYVNNPTYFVTLDYTFFDKISLSKQDILNKAKHCYFIANNSELRLKTFNTEIVDTKINMVYQGIQDYKKIISNQKLHHTGFSTNLSEFVNGANSGFAAIQLAIVLGYQKIYLLGFDMNPGDVTHFHTDYKNNFQFKKNKTNFLDTFNTAFLRFKNQPQQIKSITPTNITGVERITLDEALKSETRKNKQSYMIVAYYTIGTGYESEVKKLQASLDKLGLSYDIVGVPNLGSWQKNTRYKAKFLLEMLDKWSGYNLLYVDSDAIVHTKPILVDELTSDIAVRWQDFRWRKNECLSGTIFIKNNQNTRELCKLWYTSNQGGDQNNLEQWNLGEIISKLSQQQKITFSNLPPEYTFIFDSMKALYPNVKPVIEHFQASRKYKKTI